MSSAKRLIDAPQARPGMGAGACGERPAILLSIAGLDPSSGAGLTADLKVFAAHGCQGVAAATALTVQSTQGVRRVQAVAAEFLAETLECLADDLPIAGIKIGMLANAANVRTVATFLKERRSAAEAVIPVVLDPVLISSSGHPLIDAEGAELIRTRLLPLVTCATPNTEELFTLAGREPPSAIGRAEIEEAAFGLVKRFAGLSVVATGGHLSSPDDLVVERGRAPIWLKGEWVRTRATHGTGCGLSSALLCHLVAGRLLGEGALAAKTYVAEALRAAIPMGHGGGSMHHLYGAFPSYPERRAAVTSHPDARAGDNVDTTPV